MLAALDALARIAAERMLNSIVAGLVLTILVWALVRMVPRTNAGTRMAVWLALLVAVPALTLVAMLMPVSSSASTLMNLRIVIPEHWAFLIALAWAVISATALLRIGFGLWRVRRLRRACSPIDVAALEVSVAATVEQFRPKRRVVLLRSQSARVPMAVGFFQPAVILPDWILSELSSPELSAVLLHEFAHLRRWDDWTNLFQKILQALFFFHPALWWVDRRLALEREIACDDMVIATTNNASAYARCLLDLAEKSLLRRSVALAHAAVHRVQHMSLRVRRIMDSTRPQATGVSKLALASVMVLSGACLVAVLHSPTLIAFQDSAPDVQASRPVPRFTPAGAPESNQVHVVPAVFREKGDRSRPAAQKTSVRTRLMKPKTDSLAKVLVRGNQEAKLLRASMPAQHPTMMPVGSMLLVMRDYRVDPYGRVISTFSIWHVTLYHPVQPMSDSATVSKSI
ncbi:MAG TPA: M56 family metallopeptidase [Terriglobales bacterium]